LTISEGREGRRTEGRDRVRKQSREREGGLRDKAGREVDYETRLEG
jgi:hypothetical protein